MITVETVVGIRSLVFASSPPALIPDCPLLLGGHYSTLKAIFISNLFISCQVGFKNKVKSQRHLVFDVKPCLKDRISGSFHVTDNN